MYVSSKTFTKCNILTVQSVMHLDMFDGQNLQSRIDSEMK